MKKEENKTGIKQIGLKSFQDEKITNIKFYAVKPNSKSFFSESLSHFIAKNETLFHKELSVKLEDLSDDTINEIKNLVKDKVIVYVESYNGDLVVIGNDNGVKLQFKYGGLYLNLHDNYPFLFQPKN